MYYAISSRIILYVSISLSLSELHPLLAALSVRVRDNQTGHGIGQEGLSTRLKASVSPLCPGLFNSLQVFSSLFKSFHVFIYNFHI